MPKRKIFTIMSCSCSVMSHASEKKHESEGQNQHAGEPNDPKANSSSKIFRRESQHENRSVQGDSVAVPVRHLLSIDPAASDSDAYVATTEKSPRTRNLSMSLSLYDKTWVSSPEISRNIAELRTSDPFLKKSELGEVLQTTAPEKASLFLQSIRQEFREENGNLIPATNHAALVDHFTVATASVAEDGTSATRKPSGKRSLSKALRLYDVDVSTALCLCDETWASSPESILDTETETNSLLRMPEKEAQSNNKKTDLFSRSGRQESQENVNLHAAAHAIALDLISLVQPSATDDITTRRSPSGNTDVSKAHVLSDKIWTWSPHGTGNTGPTTGWCPMKSEWDARRSDPEKLHQERRKNQNNGSTELTHYVDPWKIKKRLTESDIGGQCRLLIGAAMIQENVIPLLSREQALKIESGKGLVAEVWDHDTDTVHNLTFKRWRTKRYYVFITGWRKSFVVRRNLKAADEVALYWDPSGDKFCFCVLKRGSY